MSSTATDSTPATGSPRGASARGTGPAASSGLVSRLPARITRATSVLALLNLIANMGIVLTGGVVRLTSSGLGCPTWPMCTEESLVNTPEMGIHGIIEFGNRTLTGILSILALLMVAALWRLRRSHAEAFWMAVGILGGVAFQAILGGITVLTQLNPWIVGAHFLVSAAMICVAALLWNRVRLQVHHGPDAALADGATTGVSRAAAWVASAALVAVLVLGTVVTGTGPHSGDLEAARHGFDALVVTRLHVVPVYLMVAAVIVLLVAVFRTAGSSASQRRSAVLLLLVLLFQAGVGYWQHFTGLPVGVVALHLVGSTLSIWAMTTVWDRQNSRYRTRPEAPVPAEPAAVASA